MIFYSEQKEFLRLKMECSVKEIQSFFPNKKTEDLGQKYEV